MIYSLTNSAVLKPNDLDLHCLQMQVISGLCRISVNNRLLKWNKAAVPYMNSCFVIFYLYLPIQMRTCISLEIMFYGNILPVTYHSYFLISILVS